MNKETIFHAITEIDDRYIEEAAPKRIIKKHRKLLQWMDNAGRQGRPEHWGKAVIIKASMVMLVVILTLGAVFYLPGKQGSSLAMINAMAAAYEKMQSMSGTIECKTVVEGMEDLVTIRAFKYKKPYRFIITEYTDNNIMNRSYDGGDVMFTEFSDLSGRIQVDFMNDSQKKEQLYWFMLTNIADKLHSSSRNYTVKQIKGETITDKETQGFEFIFNSDGITTIQRVWVDKELDLPLKWEIIYQGYTSTNGKITKEKRIITTVTELEIDPVLNDDIFTHNYQDGKEYYIHSQPDSLEIFKKYEYLFDNETIIAFQKKKGWNPTVTTNPAVTTSQTTRNYHLPNETPSTTPTPEEIALSRYTEFLKDIDINYKNFDLLSEINPDYFLVAKASRYESDNNIQQNAATDKYKGTVGVNAQSVSIVAKSIYGDQVQIRGSASYGLGVGYYPEENIYTIKATGGTRRFTPYVLEKSEKNGDIILKVCFIRYSGEYNRYDGPYYDENMKVLGTLSGSDWPFSLDQVRAMADTVPVREYVLKRRTDGSLWVKSCKMLD